MRQRYNHYNRLTSSPLSEIIQNGSFLQSLFPSQMVVKGCALIPRTRIVPLQGISIKVDLWMTSLHNLKTANSSHQLMSLQASRYSCPHRKTIEQLPLIFLRANSDGYLSFGLMMSNGVLQDILDQVLRLMPGVTRIKSDMLVTGRSKEDYYVTIIRPPEIAGMDNLEVNNGKVQVKTEDLAFLGTSNILTRKGLNLDPKKVRVIMKLDSPKTVKELQLSHLDDKLSIHYSAMLIKWKPQRLLYKQYLKYRLQNAQKNPTILKLSRKRSLLLQS